MGLTGIVARAAARRAHVLVVDVPGHFVVRAAVERELLRRGWALAASPAEADVLAVCGTPGSRLAAAVDLVWHQMPGPRCRIDVEDPSEAADQLDRAAADLLDVARHRSDARDRPRAGDLLPEREDDEMAPAGIPLAEGGDDRDGLEMDVLRVPLGPVLTHWPPGLVLWCSLHGDVIADAEVEVLDRAAHASAPDLVETAQRCDALAGLLALAGWSDAAAEARRSRDEMLAHGSGAAADRLERLRRRVRRSRSLRWSLRGLRPVTQDEIEELGLPAAVRGDTYDRLLALLAPSREEAAGAVPPEAVAALVVGLDLAAARLVVASLDPQPLPVEREAGRVG